MLKGLCGEHWTQCSQNQTRWWAKSLELCAASSRKSLTRPPSSRRSCCTSCGRKNATCRTYETRFIWLVASNMHKETYKQVKCRRTFNSGEQEGGCKHSWHLFGGACTEGTQRICAHGAHLPCRAAHHHKGLRIHQDWVQLRSYN